MRTKTVMIERRVCRDAAPVIWEMLMASIGMRSTIEPEHLDALNGHIKMLRQTHRALKAAQREGL